jgi:choice-of-anchor C domain-containing protein
MVLKSYMKRLVMFISGLALFVFLFVGTASAVPFQNGSFETGTTSGAFVQVNVGDPNITGWAVTAGSVDYINTLWTAHAGTRSIDLNSNVAGTIAQTFDTIAGHTYQVEFWLSGNPAGAPTTKTVAVDATGTGNDPLQFTFDVFAGQTLTNMGWEQNFYGFLAEGSSTTLTFASLITGSYGPALDDVSITDTFTPPVGAPEPGTIMLLLAGLVGIASARKLKG